MKHAEQVLQRRGIITTPSQKSTNSTAVKVKEALTTGA